MPTTRPDWDAYFINLAFAVSLRGDCSRSQVGAVIVDTAHRVVATGYNGAPAGAPGCLAGACPRGLLSTRDVAAYSDYESGPGRCIALHAEANALLYAGAPARCGTLYVTRAPCSACTKLVAGAGIARTVHPPRARSVAGG